MNQIPKISDTNTEEELSKKLQQLREKELEKEAKQKAQTLGVDFVKIGIVHIPNSILSLIPKDFSEKNNVAAYFRGANVIKIATSNPENPNVQKIQEELSKKYGAEVIVNIATQPAIQKVLKDYQPNKKGPGLGNVIIDEKTIEELTEKIKDYREIAGKIHKVSLSEFLNLIFASAIKVNASDIHLQPEEDEVTILFRIDGVLHKTFNITHKQFNQVKKRIKLISKLKLNIDDRPQDGRFSIKIKNKKIDMRVSSLPSNYGESIVIRILNPESVILDLSKLGMRKEILELVEIEIKKPNGMIISCGPTGSGKTTTLYTILKTINTEENKIITLENPIEYKLPGITQTQVDPNNLDFAQGLKAILRQDPDIIMVGEIRDLDTAETAVNAALTGHLVISTIHTNNAIGAIPRFIATGVKTFLLAPALNLIIGQRLVRKICQYCKVPFNTNKKILKRVKQELANMPAELIKDIDLNNLTFYQGHSCDKCNGLGYKGRIGIFEVLKIDEKITNAIQKNNTGENEIKQLAREQGMVTMAQDGILKALKGITTVEEVFRVTD